MVTMMYDEDVALDRRDRQALRKSLRWLKAHGHEIESEDQAHSLVASARTDGLNVTADHAQTVADLWDLTE